MSNPICKFLFLASFSLTLGLSPMASAQLLGSGSQNQEEADDGHGHDLKIDNLVTFKAFDLPAPLHKVFALLRKDGHSMNRPFVLEIRAACREFSGEDWSILAVGDSESLCGVDPQSLNIDPKSRELTLDYVEPDVDFYKEQIGRQAKKIKQRCMKERKTLRLSLARLCKGN